jgi:hypothetical protein
MMRAIAVTTRCTTHSQLSTYRRDESLRTTDTSLSTSSRVL